MWYYTYTHLLLCSLFFSPYFVPIQTKPGLTVQIFHVSGTYHSWAFWIFKAFTINEEKQCTKYKFKSHDGNCFEGWVNPVFNMKREKTVCKKLFSLHTEKRNPWSLKIANCMTYDFILCASLSLIFSFSSANLIFIN